MPCYTQSKNVMHNVIIVSTQLELETHLTPLWNFPAHQNSCFLHSQTFIVSSPYLFPRCSRIVWGAAGASWALFLLFLSAPHVRMTPTPALCSLYCGLFTWHCLNKVSLCCISTPALKSVGLLCSVTPPLLIIDFQDAQEENKSLFKFIQL